MYSVIRARSRICSLISKFNNNWRFSSSSFSHEPQREPIIYSSSHVHNHPPPMLDTPPPPPPPAAESEKKSFSFLKFGLFAAITGGVATAGHASYAYTLDEIDEKTNALRAYTSYKVRDDASALDKYQGLLFATVMTVPAKLVELYMDLRSLAEDQIRGLLNHHLISSFQI